MISLNEVAALRLLLPIAQAAAPTGSATATWSDGGHTFRNCSEARAAGHNNVRRGTYVNGPILDRDDDGIGCES